MSSEIFKKLSFGIKLKKKYTDNKKVISIGSEKENDEIKYKPKRILEDSDSEEEDIKKNEEKNDYGIEFVTPKNKKVKLTLTAEKKAEIHKEKMSHIRNINHIHVYGSDIPDPITSFQELFSLYNLSPILQRNISDMKFQKPTAVQIQAITAVLHRREVMVCAPTGSGKTMAFAIPLLHLLHQHDPSGFRSLILTPTHELALQIEGELVSMGRDTGLKVRYLKQAKTPKDRRRWNKADIVISTPKKFVHSLKKYSTEMNFNNIEWMVVDESDKLFEEGVLGFREQLGMIYRACKLRKSSGPPFRSLLFSATFSSQVDQWCTGEFHSLLKIHVGAINASTVDIRQRLVYTGSEAGKLMALKNLFLEGFSSPALVFTQSKQRSEELLHELRGLKVAAEAIHSDKSLVQREGIVRSFSEGRLCILISTDLMCRGLDFKLVNLVINYDFPTTSVSYIHRIGRTGRAGRVGEAITLFTNDDVIYLRSIVNIMRQSGCEVPECMLKIKKPSKSIMKELSTKVMGRASITKDDLSDNKVNKNKMARKKMQKKMRMEKIKRKGSDGGVSGLLKEGGVKSSGGGAGVVKKGGGVNKSSCGVKIRGGVKKNDLDSVKKSTGKVVNVVKDKKVRVIRMMVLNKKLKKKKIKT